MDDDENMGGRILGRRDIAKLKWVDVGMTDDATLQRRSVVRMDNYPQWLIDLKRDHDDVPGSEVKFWTARYMPAEPTVECVTALVKAWLQDWTEVCAPSVFYELDGWPKHENQWGDKHRRRYRKELVGPGLGSLRELLPLLVRAKITGFVGRPIREIPVDVERKTLTVEQLMDLLRGLVDDLVCCVQSDASHNDVDPSESVAHSSDFASVDWFGEIYSFTANQGACVRVLWENGTTYLHRIGSTNPVGATIREYSGQRKLTVFSTNVDLPTAKPLSLFAAYTFLEHRGDWIEASRALRKLGYGSPPKGTQPGLASVNGQPIDGAGELTVEIAAPPQIVSIGEMVAQYPRLRPEVVGGLLRKGEVANVIAKSKVGKSWFGYGLGLSVAAGRKWLGRFDCVRGKVLLIDNELHPEVIANRIPVVANAMGLRPEEYADRFDVLSLRGRLTPIGGLGTVMRSIERDYYSLIILDAMYRILPDGVSENDNAAMAGVYNLVDQYAKATGAAFVLVHHATKGSQADKEVTDIGAGAGAQSRAADTHLVLRPHQEEGCAVLDAAVRSFAPIEPVVLRWSFPVWIPQVDLDPEKLMRITSRQEQQQQDRDREGFEKIVIAIRENGPATLTKLEERTGVSKDRLKRLLPIMRDAPEGTEYVLQRLMDRYPRPKRGWGAINLRSHFQKIIRKAGEKPWVRLWHNLRSSCQTELTERFPVHVVCQWLGNSERIAQKHYLQVTDQHFQLAVDGEENPQHKTQQSLPNAAESAANLALGNAKTPVFRGFAIQKMTEAGFEPALPFRGTGF